MTFPFSKENPIDLEKDGEEVDSFILYLRYGQLIVNGTEMTALPVPRNLKEGLDRYAKARIPTGGFLQAVLENDLKSAMQAADMVSAIALPAIVNYIYNNLPAGCWGSPAKVQSWLAGSITER